MMIKITKLLLINFLIFTILLWTGDQILSLIGYPPARVVQVAHPPNHYERRNNIEFNIDFRTNSQGLRYDEIPLNKALGQRRVLVVGDSYTQGAGIQAEQTFSAQLERNFTHSTGISTRFINGGLGGRGPMSYWRLLYHVGFQYDLDGLLICIFANDLTDTPETMNSIDLRYSHMWEQKEPGLKRTLHSYFPRIYTILSVAFERYSRPLNLSGDFVTDVTERAKSLGIEQKIIDRWRANLPQSLVDATNNREFNGGILSYPLLYPYYWTDSMDVATPRAEKKFAAMVEIMDRMISLAQENRVEVGVVYLPMRWQYNSIERYPDHPHTLTAGFVRSEWLNGEAEIQVRLRAWAHNNEIPFLDLTPVFRSEIKYGVPLNFELDGHWNIEGHRVAAEAIRAWIIEHDVFSFDK